MYTKAVRTAVRYGMIAFCAITPAAWAQLDQPATISGQAVTGAEAAKVDIAQPASPSGAFDQLPTGYRRVTQTQRQPLTDEQIAELERAGKSAQIDYATRARVVQHITDYLPANWSLSNQTGELVDSLGRPIVNQAAGLPGWAQWDVDALRAALQQAVIYRADRAAAGGDLREPNGTLGNLIGQAIVRDIAFDDLTRLDDSAVVSDGVAQSIIQYLHFYENLKYAHAVDGDYVYVPSVYPAAIAAFINAHGRTMEDVLRIDNPENGGIAGAPSFCYSNTPFTQGMTELTGQTDIWVQSGDDDASADIATGFPIFFFYNCQDNDNNDTVRVSTNGYISFFQQGGGATDGTDFSNDPIPTTTDPDGFAGPWWDDLFVATNQPSPDRVSYKTEGAAGDRVFTVEWNSMSRLGGSTTEFHYFQVKLYETRDRVEFHYGPTWISDTVDDATIGLENYNGTSGDCGPNCGNANADEPPNNYRFNPIRPSNDSCANAIQLQERTTITDADLHNATQDGTCTCGSAATNRDVWYTYIASCNGTLNVNMCGSRDAHGDETGVDTVLSVHSACPGTTANQLACNDDTGGPGCDLFDSSVSVALTNGQQVWIRVSHFGSSAASLGNGLFTLNSNFVPTGPPGNDLCGNAAVVSDGSAPIANLNCAGAEGESACGASTGNPDVWYRFTAPSGGTLTLDCCGTLAAGGPDTVLAIYSGCPGNIGNELSCNDDSGGGGGCAGFDSRLSQSLTAGQTVRIRLSHFGFSLGNGVAVMHVNFSSCVRGDSNGDGLVNNFDIDSFVLAVSNAAACTANPLCRCRNDTNQDGLVNNFDIDSFVICVVQHGCP